MLKSPQDQIFEYTKDSRINKDQDMGREDEKGEPERKNTDR